MRVSSAEKTEIPGKDPSQGSTRPFKPSRDGSNQGVSEQSQLRAREELRYQLGVTERGGEASAPRRARLLVSSMAEPVAGMSEDSD